MSVIVDTLLALAYQYIVTAHFLRSKNLFIKYTTRPINSYNHYILFLCNYTQTVATYWLMCTSVLLIVVAIHGVCALILRSPDFTIG